MPRLHLLRVRAWIPQFVEKGRTWCSGSHFEKQWLRHRNSFILIPTFSVLRKKEKIRVVNGSPYVHIVLVFNMRQSNTSYLHDISRLTSFWKQFGWGEAFATVAPDSRHKANIKQASSESGQMDLPADVRSLRVKEMMENWSLYGFYPKWIGNL